MTPEKLLSIATDALDDLKGLDPAVLDVRGKCTVTDYLVVVSGTSNRHVKALADEVVQKAKDAGVQPMGVEGTEVSEWILVDIGDVVVHVMMPKTRDFYQLEKFWSADFSAQVS
jgi:ribosome-associated protein